MTQRTFVDKNGNSWEWEETTQVVEALKNLHHGFIPGELVKPNRIQNEQQTTN